MLACVSQHLCQKVLPAHRLMIFTNSDSGVFCQRWASWTLELFGSIKDFRGLLHSSSTQRLTLHPGWRWQTNFSTWSLAALILSFPSQFWMIFAPMEATSVSYQVMVAGCSLTYARLSEANVLTLNWSLTFPELRVQGLAWGAANIQFPVWSPSISQLNAKLLTFVRRKYHCGRMITRLRTLTQAFASKHRHVCCALCLPKT